MKIVPSMAGVYPGFYNGGDSQGVDQEFSKRGLRGQKPISRSKIVKLVYNLGYNGYMGSERGHDFCTNTQLKKFRRFNGKGFEPPNSSSETPAVLVNTRADWAACYLALAK